jgi:GNAT superfamily N-acetyltransferase
MNAAIRIAGTDDLDGLGAIEDAADVLLIDLLHPTSWRAAPSTSARAAMPGFILVITVSDDGDGDDDSDDDGDGDGDGDGDNAAPVGFAQVLEVDGFAHLEQLSVLPEYGHRGLGRALVAAAKREAGRRGYVRMTLRTFATVPWNAPFYSTCGFIASDPLSDFHRELVRAEGRSLHGDLGPRIQMTASLDSVDS